jgi:DNA-binding beta-propeller fold protein YncE
VVVMLLFGAAEAFAAVGDYKGQWGSLGTGDGEFDGPNTVALAPNGDVYVVDGGNYRIQYFSSTGTYKGQWGSYGTADGEFEDPVAVAIALNGDVYVTDYQTDRIQYFSPTGTFKGKWGSHGSGAGELYQPRGIDVAPNGDVYVADGGNDRIQYFSATGGFKGGWGSFGTTDGKFDYPTDIAFAPSGDVYVVDAANERIQYFSPTGTFKGKWGSFGAADGQFQVPRGINVALNGDVYVADYGNNRVQYFSPTGAFKGKWGSGGTGAGQFNGPYSIAIAAAGDVYVVDDLNHRIQYFVGPPAPVDRVSDRTRYSTGVAIAREAFPEWAGVKHVVIASGDDRAAADPLAASGLCWAYDAPMLLVSAARTPDEVKAAISQIVAANGPITLHIVGGVISVPNARVAELVAAGGGSGTVATDRILATGNRFDLARAIALRMRGVAAADPAKTMPKVALFANGADVTKFFDALALSPISGARGAPILLVTATSIPPATAAALADLAPTTRIVGGGPNTVSETVRSQLGATRWSGRTRYDTAIAIANGAVAKGWLGRSTVGIAAKLPDALTGGSLVGKRTGVLVLTDTASLTPATKTWLATYKRSITEVLYLFGGPLSITDTVRTQVAGALE